MKLAIVIPCYNEEEVLHETVSRMTTLINTMKTAGEISSADIICVDDGSRDRTWQLVKELGVRGVKLAHNVGHQNALWAGLELAWREKYDCSVSIDADLQDDINCIRDMVREYAQGKDIVFGVRRERKTDTIFKRQTALAFYRIMATLGGEIVYNHADYRLMSHRALTALMQYPERNMFLRGIVKNIGLPYSCVFYDRSERFAGESKYPLSKMLNFAIDGITSFSVKPLRIITTLGLVCIIISMALIIWGLVQHFTGNTLQGWTSIIVSIWFIGGAILTALGVIGEYIGKIYKEVKQRPRYFAEEII